MTQDFGTLQPEQAEWSMRNFGPKDKHQPLLGIIEELGELEEAMEELDRAKALDAAGDIVVYTADFCTQWGWDLNELYRLSQKPRAVEVMPLRLSYVQGRLAHHQLKWEQKIRNAEGHEGNLRSLVFGVLEDAERVCQYLGTNLVDIALDTWSTVKKRNWTKNPDNAHEVAGG